MALRLAGEEFSVVQGLDGQGWVNELASGAKIPSPQINGVVTTTGLTLPTFTLGGNITIGAYKIAGNLVASLDNTYDLGSSAITWATAYVRLMRDVFDIQTVGNASINAVNSDGGVALFRARDTGVGLVTVARLVGAADPYFEATLGARLAPMAQPGTPIQGMLIYNNVTNKLNFYNGSAWEVVTSV